MKSAPDFNIRPFGDNGWLAHFQDNIESVALALHLNKIAALLREEKTLTDCVAGVNTIAVRFSPAVIDATQAREQLRDAILKTSFDVAPAPIKHIDIPVVYGGKHGPDFDDLCRRNALTKDQLIEAHTARAYRVLMVGFAPGFTYLGPLSERLKTPRLKTPRQYVPAGSVGVAGDFTGVYSLPSPGGWRIIGRTPKKLFNKTVPSPFMFEAGAEVRFTAISADEFEDAL